MSESCSRGSDREKAAPPPDDDASMVEDHRRSVSFGAHDDEDDDGGLGLRGRGGDGRARRKSHSNLGIHFEEEPEAGEEGLVDDDEVGGPGGWGARQGVDDGLRGDANGDEGDGGETVSALGPGSSMVSTRVDFRGFAGAAWRLPTQVVSASRAGRHLVKHGCR
jgi:hypothetical protein